MQLKKNVKNLISGRIMSTVTLGVVISEASSIPFNYS